MRDGRRHCRVIDVRSTVSWIVGERAAAVIAALLAQGEPDALPEPDPLVKEEPPV